MERFGGSIGLVSGYSSGADSAREKGAEGAEARDDNGCLHLAKIQDVVDHRRSMEDIVVLAEELVAGRPYSLDGRTHQHPFLYQPMRPSRSDHQSGFHSWL